MIFCVKKSSVAVVIVLPNVPLILAFWGIFSSLVQHYSLAPPIHLVEGDWREKNHEDGEWALTLNWWTKQQKDRGSRRDICLCAHPSTPRASVSNMQDAEQWPSTFMHTSISCSHPGCLASMLILHSSDTYPSTGAVLSGYAGGVFTSSLMMTTCLL